MENMFWAVLKGPWDGHNNISNLCLHKNLITSPPTCVWRLVVMPSSKDFLSSDSTSIQCQRTKTFFIAFVCIRRYCAHCLANWTTEPWAQCETKSRCVLASHSTVKQAFYIFLHAHKSRGTQAPLTISLSLEIAVLIGWELGVPQAANACKCFPDGWRQHDTMSVNVGIWS